MARKAKRNGIDRPGVCNIDTPLLIRGDIVSMELASGRTVEFPESWGLVHDVTGECADKCEIFICPYTVRGPIGRQVDDSVHEAATSYWGDDYKLVEGNVVIPDGPWDRVDRILRVYYDRYGELASKYQHPFEREVSSAAILYKQRRASKCADGKMHRSYRISLPDSCVVNAHGFVWP